MTEAAQAACEALAKGTATMDGLVSLKAAELKAIYERYMPRGREFRPRGLSTKADYAEYLLSRMPEPRKPGQMDETDALDAVHGYAADVWGKMLDMKHGGDAAGMYRAFETGMAAVFALGYRLGWAEAKAADR